MSTQNLPPQAQQLLEQMHDIQAPDPVGWWPLAPGWWLIIIVTLAIIAALVYWYIKRTSENRYRAQALTLLEPIAKRPEQYSVTDINDLLKRTALHAYPQDQSAIVRSYGESWVQWLNSKCDTQVFDGGAADALTAGIYRDGQQAPTQPLIAAARDWLQQHRRGNSSSRGAYV